MSLIRNLVKEPEKKFKKDEGTDSDDAEKKERPIIKSATDLHRLKIEKLMKNPEKPVNIPNYASLEAKRNREIEPPSFVRNVMGSSAGAGSGEFHVYRHLRRKEYARQKGIQIKSLTEQLDQEYQEKLEENRRIADGKTAKKRAKRLKKKQRAKEAKKSKPNSQTAAQLENEHYSTDGEDGDDDHEEKEHTEKYQTNKTTHDVHEIENSSNEQLGNDVKCKVISAEELGDAQDDALQEDLNKVD